jgi:hypothetical protein
MRKLILLLAVLVCVLGAPGPLHAQDGSGADDEEKFIATMGEGSAFTYEKPIRISGWVSSIFEDQQLEVVGRNLDGTWFEVRRPGRLTNIGWIEVKNLYVTFDPEKLPLTDLETGREGPTPLEEDPGFAIYLLYGAILREDPLRSAPSIMSVPLKTTLPVLARNQDGSWLRVNYLGYVGWIVAFVGRDIPNKMDIPLAPDLPPLETPEVIIIPPEVQRAQIQRLRDFILPRRELAGNLEVFWLMVQRGEILPCNPPESVTAITYLRDDVRQLPEIDRYAPQLNMAVDYLNNAVDTLQACGVVKIKDVRQAYLDAINARVLFDATLEALDNLEKTIK